MTHSKARWVGDIRAEGFAVAPSSQAEYHQVMACRQWIMKLPKFQTVAQLMEEGRPAAQIVTYIQEQGTLDKATHTLVKYVQLFRKFILPAWIAEGRPVPAAPTVEVPPLKAADPKTQPPTVYEVAGYVAGNDELEKRLNTILAGDETVRELGILENLLEIQAARIARTLELEKTMGLVAPGTDRMILVANKLIETLTSLKFDLGRPGMKRVDNAIPVGPPLHDWSRYTPAQRAVLLQFANRLVKVGRTIQTVPEGEPEEVKAG